MIDDCADSEKERECKIDTQTCSPAKKLHFDGHHKTSSDVEFVNVFELDHCYDDLDGPVDKTVPLYRLLSEFERELNCSALEENKATFNVVLEMVNKIAQELSVTYKIFEECYVLPVGSFIENTKIGRPDELDFSISLSCFENFDKLDSLYTKSTRYCLMISLLFPW